MDEERIRRLRLIKFELSVKMMLLENAIEQAYLKNDPTLKTSIENAEIAIQEAKKGLEKLGWDS